MTSSACGPSNVRAQFNGFPVVLRGGKCLVIARFAFRAHAREVVPDAGRIGVLNDINDPKASPQWKNTSCHIRSLAVIFGSNVPELWAQFSGFADASQTVIAMISGFERF
jgi:hypothetical protein